MKDGGRLVRGKTRDEAVGLKMSDARSLLIWYVGMGLARVASGVVMVICRDWGAVA